MPGDAVVLDYGDTLEVDVGQDLTGATELSLHITKPDASLTTKTTADGVNDGSAPTEQVIYYTLADGDIASGDDGSWRVSASFVNSNGQFSYSGYSKYVVLRRNQTV